jgi:Zn-dependent peptidase ImmA (M78 family)
MDIQQIRRKTTEVLNQYNPGGLVPFPFTEMAEQLGDVDLVLIDTLPENISGAIYVQSDRFTVIINTQKPEVRQYFTTAHEFAHYFLHSDWLRENESKGFVDFSDTLDADGMLLRPDDPSTVAVDLQKEREANSFAAELIMPEDKVREFWNLTHDITSCANAFQVSQSAMAVRLETIGLVL